MASLFGGVIERRRYCPQCKKNVLAREAAFDNTTHAGLTLVTCGLWLPLALVAAVWHAFARGGYYCPACGSKCR
jgi:competence CoiA-like predicted nuclease